MDQLQNILNLSVAERIQLVEAIWDSISNEAQNSDIDPETKNLLDQRLSEHKKDPNAGSSWEEVKNRILGKS